MLRQQAAYGDSRPSRSLADYGAGRRPHRRVRGHRRNRPRRALRPVRGRTRRLQLDHREGSRRPLRRGVRRVPARGRAARVVRDRAEAQDRTTDRRAFPRHPPGIWLPRVSRPQREAEALRAARCRGRRHLAHGVVRDAPGCKCQRALSRPSRRALLLRGSGGLRPGRGLRGAEGHAPRRGRAVAPPEPSYEPGSALPGSPPGAGSRGYAKVAKAPGRRSFFWYADDAEEGRRSRRDPQRQRPPGASPPVLSRCGAIASRRRRRGPRAA
jgi:hypothetical protein